MKIISTTSTTTTAGRRSPATLAGLALLLIPALAAAQDTSPAESGDLVPIKATSAQPVGMDEAAIKAFLTDQLGRNLSAKEWKKFEFLWEQGFLFLTPAHEVAVTDFEISRFEVTNAQWKVFLDAPINADSDQTQPGMTLKTLVHAIYQIDADSNPVEAQRAGLYLYYRNEGRLMGALNPDADPKWEPLKAWVEDTEIPAGTTIDFTLILPPSYWERGEIPEDELAKPVRFVSWDDARLFCRWAGMHIPLEAEWERTARGDEGRLFPWGNEWNPQACVWKHSRGERENNAGPEPVDTMADGATPEGVHHMLGNVSEFVFDFARTYPGSKSKFKFNNSGVLARGGMWDDEDFVMLAADRIWDVGTTQIGVNTRADGFGFRLAMYPQGGRDLALELATYASEFFRVKGAATWLPYPVGLSAGEREKRDKRQLLQGFSLDRTAGWVQRDMNRTAENHVNVNAPAKGIAFVPIKGLLGSFLKDKGRFKKLCLDKEEVALVGALVATTNCKIQLENTVADSIESVTIDMGDQSSSLWTNHDLGFRYQVGAWLVLEGERVAVYAGDGSDAGVFGAHLKGKPLGYLPAPFTDTWAITAETSPAGGYANGIATLSAPIPQIEKDGSLKSNGKAILLEIKVPATFE